MNTNFQRSLLANKQIIKLFNQYIILSIVFFAHLLICTTTHCQTAIASAGGYVSTSSTAAGISLSYTVGETNTQTLSTASHMLTQGFQQPYRMHLNLKAFIEGYYVGSNTMENVLYNQGVTATSGNECDSITVQLRQAGSPYTLVSETKHILQTNGQLSFNGTAAIGQAYYIIIKSRNIIETWSANPVMFNENTFYDFTTDANKAYGNNQSQVAIGVWALYSGDLNADENVDLLDLVDIETDINNFEFGYFATDINGDGNVDLLDAPIVENNINAFIFSSHP